MGCSLCGKAKSKTVVETIDHRLTTASKIATVIFSGGDVEQAVKRAEICKGCDQLTDYQGLVKLNFDMLKLAASWTASKIPSSHASKVKKAIPEIKDKFCSQCGCVVALKVLTKIEVVRNEKGEITNSAEIEEDTCPINLWSFHKIGEKY